MTATVPDARASGTVTPGVGALLAQRVFAIACGHSDGTDADRLADDPIHKLLLGRDPIDGRWLVPKLRRAFPGARLRVRLDGGFATPDAFDHLEAARVEHVVAMAGNAVLARHAEPAVALLRAIVATTQDTATTYAEAAYQTDSWAAPQRTIIKAEVVWHHGREPRDNPRFVITNLRQTSEWIDTRVYCARGDGENRLKELKHAVRLRAHQVHALRPSSCVKLQLRADQTA